MSDQHTLIPDTVESLRQKNAMLADICERREKISTEAMYQCGQLLIQCSQLREALDASQRIQDSLTQQIEDLWLQANKETIEYCNCKGTKQ